MAITTFPSPQDDRNEQLKKAAEQLQMLLQDTAASFDVELTRQRQRLYIAALLPFPLSQVRAGIVRGLRKWRFFPQVAEILEVMQGDDRDPVEVQKACDLKSKETAARYKAARDAGTLPQSPYRSVHEQLKIGPLNRPLTRREELILGIEKPRQLSPLEQEERLRELHRQAVQLASASGETGAGSTGGPA